MYPSLSLERKQEDHGLISNIAIGARCCSAAKASIFPHSKTVFPTTMRLIHIYTTALFFLSFDLYEGQIAAEAKNNELFIQEIKKKNDEIFNIAINKISMRINSSITKIQEIKDKDTADHQTRKSEQAKLVSIKTDFPHTRSTSKIQEDRLKRFPSDGTEVTSSALSRMQKTLKEHKVTISNVQEIAGFTSSYIPKSAIVAHVQTHFPEKSVAEANDIVIAANIASGTVQLSKSHDMQKYSSEKAAKDLLKFEKAKELFLLAKKTVTI